MGFHVKKLGFDVDVAEDGAQAVAMTGRKAGADGDEPYDVVLMDCVMPVMDGLEASRRIRSGGHRMLIVGVTGNALAEDIDQFLAAGADCVVTKPVSVTGLKETLERHGLLAD